MIEEAGPTRVVRSVKEFVNGLSRWFASHRQLQNVAISGEVSGFHVFGSGHAGFTLKEEQSILECVVWADKRRELPDFKDGMAVIAVGKLRIRPERSGYQFMVESIELTGLGDLFVLYERLKAKFRSEGLFEASRKRAVPALPRRVGLITARGKGMQDFVETLERNAPFVEVIFRETRVQGVGAEVEISDALDWFARANVDAIVLTRGGGSYEDLFPFNREAVVRAIVRSKVPVLTAIGHSGDHHLADDVADEYYGTPSLAAEAVTKGWQLAIGRLQLARRDLQRATRDVVLRGEQRVTQARIDVVRCSRRVLAEKRVRLGACAASLERYNPQRVLADERGRLARYRGRLNTAAALTMSRKTHTWRDGASGLQRAVTALQNSVGRKLERCQAALDRVDPLAPLRRGYAIVTYRGQALRDAGRVTPGDTVHARLERGMLAARVESISHDE